MRALPTIFLFIFVDLAQFTQASIAETGPCPYLVGQYTCTDDFGEKSTLKISQNGVISPVIYKISDSENLLEQEIKTDGVFHRLPDNIDLHQQRQKALCKQSQLVLDLEAVDVNARGEPTGTITMQSLFTSLANGLRIDSSGIVVPKVGESTPFSGSLYCLRQMPQNNCPQLKGRFLCQLGNNTQIVEISQHMQDGQTKYVIDGADVITDGEPHVMNNSLYRNGWYWARCEDQQLHIQIDADFHPTTQSSGRIQLALWRGIDNAGNFTLRNEGQLIGSGNPISLKAAGVCKTLPTDQVNK